MRKKKQIFCKCGNQADWYKQGKAKKVLICHSCGMIAHNPLPFLAVAAAETIGKYALNKVISKDKPIDKSPHIEKSIIDSLDRPNRQERVINQVLYGEC